MIPPNESYRIYPMICPFSSENDLVLYNEINIKFSCYNINSSIQLSYKSKQVFVSSIINRAIVYIAFYIFLGKG